MSKKHQVVRFKRYGEHFKFTVNPKMAADLGLEAGDQLLLVTDSETKVGWFRKITQQDVEVFAALKGISEPPWKRKRKQPTESEPPLPLAV